AIAVKFCATTGGSSTGAKGPVWAQALPGITSARQKMVTTRLSGTEKRRTDMVLLSFHRAHLLGTRSLSYGPEKCTGRATTLRAPPKHHHAGARTHRPTTSSQPTAPPDSGP